jgi:hypothetical protein
MGGTRRRLNLALSFVRTLLSKKISRTTGNAVIVCSLLASFLLALPVATHAQGTFEISAGGTISEIDGTGSSLPGFPLGASATITITGKNSDIQLGAGNGSTSGASDYIDPNAIVTFTGTDGSYQYEGVQFDVINNGGIGTGTTDSLQIVLPPGNLNTSINGIGLSFPASTVPDSSWSSGLIMLNSGLSGAIPGVNSVTIGYDSTGENGAACWLSSYSFTDPVPVAEPSTLSLEIFGGAFALGMAAWRKNNERYAFFVKN